MMPYISVWLTADGVCKYKNNTTAMGRSTRKGAYKINLKVPIKDVFQVSDEGKWTGAFITIMKHPISEW